MTIKTKFEVGDTVWVCSGGKTWSLYGPVTIGRIECNIEKDKTTIYYFCAELNCSKTESELFKTVDEAIAPLPTKRTI